MKPQPQMVGSYGVSDDQLTWTFKLRDGLYFTDGTAVTSADCIASMRRWAVRDGAGQHMFARTKRLDGLWRVQEDGSGDVSGEGTGTSVSAAH